MTDYPETEAIEAAMRRLLDDLGAAAGRGVPRVGWKVAFHDAATRERLGLAAPLMAPLDGERLIAKGEDYHPRPGGKPLAEVEVALRIGRKLSGDVSLEDARAAIAGVAPAFEFVDASKPAPKPGGMAAALGGAILRDAVAFGDERPLAELPALGEGTPKLLRGGEVIREAQPGRVPADVATVVVSAAAILGRFCAALEPGDRIICGSYIEPIAIAPGDELVADFGPFGSLATRVGEPA